MREFLKQELEKLRLVIHGNPQGITMHEILEIFKDSVPKRTVQYRVALLIEAGEVYREGNGKNIRYFTSRLLEKDKKDSFYLEPSHLSGVYLSKEGLQLQRMLSKPMQERMSVVYQRGFLDAYQPNQTSYLSLPIINKLTSLGAGADQGRPAGTYARKIYQRLLIDLSWNSSRLEGNTYSLLETERLLETGQEVPGKSPLDTQMILNHKEAIEFIVDMAEEVNINRYTILNIHALLSNNLLSDPKACGRLRSIPVKIGKSVYNPLVIPQLIEECFDSIIKKAAAIKNPFEQAFFLMVQLPYLQPFLDVNERVSRLAANIPLIRENLSPLSFVDVPESDYIQGLLAIYELNKIELLRDVFVWAYERSASLYLQTLEALGQPDLFKLHYHDLIKDAVNVIVFKKMNKLQASTFIAAFAKQHVPMKDLGKFIETVEIELTSLHEGNFARFKIRPVDFFEWQASWR